MGLTILPVRTRPDKRCGVQSVCIRDDKTNAFPHESFLSPSATKKSAATTNATNKKK